MTLKSEDWLRLRIIKLRAEVDALRADAARYHLLASLMVHVGHPAGSGWTLDEVLVSGDRDLDEVIDAMAKEQICAVAKNGQIQEGSR
jgi:hypothetical protein